MDIITFVISCLIFLSIFVGLPIIGVAYLIINHVENKRNKRYLKWIEHLDKLEKGRIHYTR